MNIREILKSKGERFAYLYDNKSEFREAIKEIIESRQKIIKETIKDLEKTLHNCNEQEFLVDIKLIIKTLKRAK